jgi:hypothetical protein
MYKQTGVHWGARGALCPLRTIHASSRAGGWVTSKREVAASSATRASPKVESWAFQFWESCDREGNENNLRMQ